MKKVKIANKFTERKKKRKTSLASPLEIDHS